MARFAQRAPAFGSLLTGAAIALLMPPDPACAAPAHLLNKTAVVSFTVSVPARMQDGTTLVARRAVTRTIYISSQGRVFVRVSRRAKGGSQDREIGPEQGGGSIRLVGDRLTGVLPFASGASQLTVTFDQSGSTCNASVIFGAESGRPITWKGLNGAMMTATEKPSVSAASCSISPGNALAR